MLKKLFGFGKKKEESFDLEKYVEEAEKYQHPNEADESESKLESDENTEIGSVAETDNIQEDLDDNHMPEEIHEEKEIVEDISSESSEEIEAEEIEVEDGEDLEETEEEHLEEIDVEHEEDEVPAEEPPAKMSIFQRLKEGLTKTSKSITDKLDVLIHNYGEIDEDLFEELEEILITADIGMDTTLYLVDKLREELKARKIKDASLVKEVLRDVMAQMLDEAGDSSLSMETPQIILVIGVNGAGKTTSIGKITNRYKENGKTVLLAAADTFRAAAVEQLKMWGERSNVPVISHQEGSDPAAVVYDAIQAARSRSTDVLICDTAGRLHNKKNLMNELAKIFKIVDREYGNAKLEVLLVLDATTGQNAVVQAKAFKEAANITGIVLTKLDGTAKGGVILSITKELGIPVKLIGVGEGINDLQNFDSKSFVSALLNIE